jgi:REP element-mobilizing transposase RayT
MLAAHVVISTYGFWLPNDPRGSWSQYVGNRRLHQFGDATKVTTHRSVARRSHDRTKRLAAKRILKYPAVRLTGVQAQAACSGFSQAIREGGYAVYACAILPDHAHLVVARHLRSMPVIAGHLKGRATRELRERELWLPDRPVWGRRSWAVFLDLPADVLRAIRYAEQNPAKEGKPRQCWSFVTPFD